MLRKILEICKGCYWDGNCENECGNGKCADYTPLDDEVQLELDYAKMRSNKEREAFNSDWRIYANEYD